MLPIWQALAASFSFTTRSMDASAAAQQTGLPVCVEVMVPMGCESMISALPATAASGKRARNTLSEQRQIRHYAVVLKAPHGSGSSKTGLHFVQNQQCFVTVAPLSKRPHILGGSESGACALVSLHQYAAMFSWIDILFVEAALKMIEGCIGSAEAIRKRHLHEAGIQVADPFL